MEVHNQLSKYILIILFSILGNSIFSQSINQSYITQDTLIIKNPTIIMVKGYDGKFILNGDLLELTQNIQKAIENNEIFLYNDDGIGFISSKDRKKNNVSIGECSYIKKEETKNLIILRLPPKVDRFYLGFVQPNFYNKKVTSSNNKRPYLKLGNDFKPILYPICEDSNAAESVSLVP